MNNPGLDLLSVKLTRLLGESSRRSCGLHRQFLQLRQDALHDMRGLIELQMRAASGAPAARPALFGSRQLDEFGVGQLSNCLGPAFARYDGQRIPRIPNGELKMMSRITAITGTPRDPCQPAQVTAEYDVPASAWYYRDNAYPEMPCSVLMEIALQPCGFLSAYLDTYALVPYGEFHFRNLDGSARLLARMDLRGRTITTVARLISSVVSGGTVIQKFAFELACEGRAIYAGESTFGYFSAESMSNQVGLDGGRSTLPALHTDTRLARAAQLVDLHRLQVPRSGKPHYRLSQGHMDFLNETSLVKDGGRYGQGYVYASRMVNPGDWFYPFHFFGDPVMPGSLGVEAMMEAVQAYALVTDLGGGLRSPRFGVGLDAAPTTWRYRGQITPQHKKMELEVHLRGIDQRVGEATLSGDASLWVDGLRIYEVKNASLGILEG